MSKTVDQIIGELHREAEGLRSQMAAYCEPVKERIKETEKKIKRLLLEDGRQQIDLTLLDRGDE
jgi:hypothetical protein